MGCKWSQWAYKQGSVFFCNYLPYDSPITGQNTLCQRCAVTSSIIHIFYFELAKCNNRTYIYASLTVCRMHLSHGLYHRFSITKLSLRPRRILPSYQCQCINCDQSRVVNNIIYHGTYISPSFNSFAFKTAIVWEDIFLIKLWSRDKMVRPNVLRFDKKHPSR